MKIACCIFAYEITKGLKSIGPLGLTKRNSRAKPFLLEQMEYVKNVFGGTDFYIITGFENKKIESILPKKKYITTIYNDKYNTKNHGLATKLFLDKIKNNLKNYDGCLILEQNTLLKKIKYKHKKRSWIATVSKHIGDSDNLNVLSIDNKQVKYLFYRIEGNFWCHNLYLTSRDLERIIGLDSLFHDNMFLFEIINSVIDSNQVEILENKIHSIKDHLHFVYPKLKK